MYEAKTFNWKNRYTTITLCRIQAQSAPNNLLQHFKQTTCVCAHNLFSVLITKVHFDSVLDKPPRAPPFLSRCRIGLLIVALMVAVKDMISAWD